MLSEAAQIISGFCIGNDNLLPWRVKRTPYRVFLAECLLVRTRADIVASRFETVFKLYPNIGTLANANESGLAEVLKPFGLVKRAGLIIKAANHICGRHGGRIPSAMTELLDVPGIGPYTAAAIRALAFGTDDVPADSNVFRFLSRFTGLTAGHRTKGSSELRSLVPLLSPANKGPTAEALLAFTRIVCRPRNPECAKCLVTFSCHYASDERQKIGPPHPDSKRQ